MPVNMTNNNIANTTKLISTLIREQNPGAKRELLVKLTPLSQLDFWLSVFCVFSTFCLDDVFPLSSSSKTTRPSEPQENT